MLLCNSWTKLKLRFKFVQLYKLFLKHKEFLNPIDWKEEEDT